MADYRIALEEAFKTVCSLEKRARSESDIVLAAIVAYTPIQLHRLTSGSAKRSKISKFVSLRIFFELIAAVSKWLVSKPVVIPREEKLLLWMQNYQYPSIDDEPFKAKARELGMTVVSPRGYWGDKTYTLISTLRLLRRYRSACKEIGHAIYEANGNDLDLKEKEIVDSLLTKEALHPVCKALMVSMPFIKECFGKAECIVVHRHNGDISASLARGFLAKETSVSRHHLHVMLAHEGNPANVPISTVGCNVDYVWARNSVSYNVFSHRPDMPESSRISTVGDPRREALISRARTPEAISNISIALTESRGESFFEGQDSETIEFLHERLNHTSDFSLRIKRREPLGLIERLVAVSHIGRKSGLLRLVANEGLPKNIFWSDFAIIVANANLRMLSGVVYDYLENGVPVVILASGGLDDSWKGDFSKLRDIAFSFGEFEDLIENKGWESLIEKAYKFHETNFPVSEGVDHQPTDVFQKRLASLIT